MFKIYFRYFQYLISIKYYTFKYCFYAGVYWRGITHNLTYFKPTIFRDFAKLTFIKDYKPTESCLLNILYIRNHIDSQYHYWYTIECSNIRCSKMPYKPFIEMIYDIFAQANEPIDATQLWYYTVRPKAVAMNKTTMEQVDKVMDFLKESDSFKKTCKNLKRIYYES